MRIINETKCDVNLSQNTVHVSDTTQQLINKSQYNKTKMHIKQLQRQLLYS